MCGMPIYMMPVLIYAEYCKNMHLTRIVFFTNPLGCAKVYFVGTTHLYYQLV